MLLNKLVTSRVPVIEIINNDPVYIQEVLENLLGSPVKAVTKILDEKNTIFLSDTITPNSAIYKDLLRLNSVLLHMVKAPTGNNISYPFGHVFPSYSFLEKNFKLKLADYHSLTGLTATQINTILRYSGGAGVSIKEALNTLYTPSEGLYFVPTDETPYTLTGGLKRWYDLNYPILKKDIPVLRPRGLMLTGQAGTGKTSFAKYLGNQLGWTVVRLDISNSLKRYLGESEQTVKQHLQTVSQMTPCILVLDEVEKLFNGVDETGVVTRILSFLLWWLAEHKERIFVIMTSNDLSQVPKELYREGRIDEVITLSPLENSYAVKFALKWLSDNQLMLDDNSKTKLKEKINEQVPVTPTKAIQIAKTIAKEYRKNS